MVDFGKLRKASKKEKSPDPLEIFRRLPKPPGINDLYNSQAEVLKSWFTNRNRKDTVLKLHTGGGKTLVGLLMAQSSLDELGEPVLYLAPTVQLVNQTLDKAKLMGIAAVPYRNGQDLDENFVNANSIMVATYNALFNGQSKFRLRERGHYQQVGAVILDDAHVAFSVIRDAFTLEVKKKNDKDRYQSLTGLFRKSFSDCDRLGIFDDVVGGREYAVLEIPYWAWDEQIGSVREQLKTDAEEHPFHWPLLRNELHLCHGLISRDAFTVTPIVPLIRTFPTFSDAPRRIFMSATIANDGDIVRTFDADPNEIKSPLTSRSLAGVSERMILIPDLMKFKSDRESIAELAKWTSKQRKGSVILVSSDKAAENWSDDSTVATGSAEVGKLVDELQNGSHFGPAVFANRYDGIDLPGDSCRLLVLQNLPKGTSNYELFRAAALAGGASLVQMLAQRIEQGIGRGARGSGDHCVVIMSGPDLAGWLAKNANFMMLTSATRAQIEMGVQISEAVESVEELSETIARSFARDPDWTEFHAETLAELESGNEINEDRFSLVSIERKAVNLWQDGYHEKAISKIEKVIDNASGDIDRQSLGWMAQLAARIASHWGVKQRAEEFQKHAFSFNRNLLRPRVKPPYESLPAPDEQAVAIAKRIEEYRLRQGILRSFEDTVSHLHDEASATLFEAALAELGRFIGLFAEQHDTNGEGPDVLWLLPIKCGFVIEAKSRKKPKNELTKTQHGQLLVAAEWFKANYPDYECVRVSMHPKNEALKNASAEASHALTYENLAKMVTETRILLTEICELQNTGADLVNACGRLIERSNLSAKTIASTYFVPFEQIKRKSE
ncbi:DEAD/DEAH box helicase [Crateriforma conspicua]|uniref:DEAD/DEAH box helicase n=1 Tax=Crateriforma conspicua TaxID=2527996 RepID=UPI0011880233|nr:DEAD/DEAH box helicase [Crateriforma conspicua]QDV66272.1 DEAD/DEAH box helicase [Crateriforma conspicua]